MFVLLWTALAYSKKGTGVAGQNEVWLGERNQGVESCFKRVMADSRCVKDFFTYVTRGDGNCGCKGSKGALKIRGDDKADYYSINSTTTVATTKATGAPRIQLTAACPTSCAIPYRMYSLGPIHQHMLTRSFEFASNITAVITYPSSAPPQQDQAQAQAQA